MTLEKEESYVNTMKIHGFPLKCARRRNTIIKTSKSKENPGRPFFRCPKFRDEHLFKWVEDDVHEEVVDGKTYMECCQDDIRNIKVDIEILKNVNEELMEEVIKVKSELKRLDLFMKLGLGILCCFLMICIVVIFFGKSKGLNLGSY